MLGIHGIWLPNDYFVLLALKSEAALEGRKEVGCCRYQVASLSWSVLGQTLAKETFCHLI